MTRTTPLTLLFALFISRGASAQPTSSTSPDALPADAFIELPLGKRWFALDAPFTRRIQFSFDSRPAPTFELLQLPIFEGRLTMSNHKKTSLSLFERIAPTAELDCSRTCAVVLDHSVGIDARARLGGFGERVPHTYLFAQGDQLRLPRGFVSRAWVGFGGLLDF